MDVRTEFVLAAVIGVGLLVLDHWGEHLRHTAQGKLSLGHPRSTRWRTVRSKHLEEYPRCAACGGTQKLEVHHILPFHLHPSRELDPDNLITLCEAWTNGANCHLALGHLGSYQSFNHNVHAEAEFWREKVEKRP